MADEKGYAPYLSVVIPTLNEERHISSTLESLGTANDLEIIVADGGSTDRTRTIAAMHGVRIVSTAPGRANQMNAGAAIARGEVLLFLHADTRPPFGFSSQIKNCLCDPTITIGAFRFALDATRLSLRLIEFGVNVRSRTLGLPFGDQGLFLRRTTFNEAGGFRDLPIMEDYDLVARLGAGGRIRIVSTSAITSARRWITHGILRTSLTNAALIIGWKLGVTPARLATWRSRKSHLNRKLEFPAPACEEPAKD
ncbi:MAG: TIGR04283 family arsenosugar biosynthesis glycosyltransferase [Candidatus Hydrogenedentes bacterium]|nr:TIGR04283 family arsenosugar biosynthesis glycosyltransferase [Candidatus Hydrogenedentota bacterium]